MAIEGDKAPEFTLETDGGGTISLEACKGRPVVLYFYPKDDTSGCTKEAIAFTGLAAEFDALDTPVIGISPDTVASHDKFKDKHALSVVLGADTENVVAEAYGVWVEKNMYGRKYMGVERATFLIDGKGKVVRAWRKVKVPGHAEAVLAAVKELSSSAG